MAIIVKADMPGCCGYGCDLWNEGICVPLQKVVDLHARDNDCPILGEIPDEHGRLIDADVIGNWLREQHVFSMSTTCKIDSIIKDAPTVIEASTSPTGFCNTEGCSNSKPDMSKAQNHICPYYQGVCSLDEDMVCYCQHHYETCDKFIEVSKERK